MILLYPTYFAPLLQYAAILQNKNYEFEVEDNFQKQTYRNRCYIYSPNGKQLLNVPIQHVKNQIRQKTKDIKIDNETVQWQKIHLKSLQAAYRSSPYFEFYEDEIETIFTKNHTFLLDLNLEVHNFVMECLQEKADYSKSIEFHKNPVAKIDLRYLTDAKKKLDITFNPYTQMFDEKHGFIENLSILDLLFMQGPASSIYLNAIECPWNIHK